MSHFAPLSRRWTMDGIDRNESSIDGNKKTIGGNVFLIDESKPNIRSPPEIDEAASQRSLHQVSMAEDLKTSVVKRIINAGSHTYLHLGLSTTATNQDIESCVTAHFKSLPARYALAIDVDAVVQNMRLQATAKDTKSNAVHCCYSHDTGTSSITIACPDRPKVYNRITAALDRVASNILEADIMTSTEGVVLDRFVVNLKSRYVNRSSLVEEEIIKFLSFDSRTLSDPSFRLSSSSSSASPPSSENSDHDINKSVNNNTSSTSSNTISVVPLSSMILPSSSALSSNNNNNNNNMMVMREKSSLTTINETTTTTTMATMMMATSTSTDRGGGGGGGGGSSSVIGTAAGTGVSTGLGIGMGNSTTSSISYDMQRKRFHQDRTGYLITGQQQQQPLQQPSQLQSIGKSSAAAAAAAAAVPLPVPVPTSTTGSGTSSGIGTGSSQSTATGNTATGTGLLRSVIEARFPPVPTLRRSGQIIDVQVEMKSPESRRSEYLELTLSDMQEMQEIGRGLVSVTFSAIMKETNTLVVLKRPLFQQESHLFEEEVELLKKEIALMRGLVQHGNVCRMIGACTTSDSEIFVCYEHLSGGSLWNLIHNREVETYDYIKIAMDIACGMRFLHDNGILHRDLKSVNVLLDHDGVCKVADFGLSCSLSPSRDLTAETGTYRWMAPEVIRHEPYSTPADVFSFGILLWELIAREQPYAGMTPIQAAFGVAKDNLRPVISPTAPPRAKALMQRCWHGTPSMRPPFQEIVELLPQLR